MHVSIIFTSLLRKMYIFTFYFLQQLRECRVIILGHAYLFFIILKQTCVVERLLIGKG